MVLMNVFASLLVADPEKSMAISQRPLYNTDLSSEGTNFDLFDVGNGGCKSIYFGRSQDVV